MATVSHIFISATRGAPMVAVPRAQAIAGVGLEGDRYAQRQGSFSTMRPAVRDVTLISARDVAQSNAALAQPFTLAETRRNIVIEGEVNLRDLIGKEFTIGAISLRGVEEADPCARPERLSGKPEFARAFVHRAGIRAEILTSGEVSVGDVFQGAP